MTDGIIKGTGNSRFLKSVPDILTRYPTWDAAAAALRDGTFPFDLNGINELGWQVLGTPLNAATFKFMGYVSYGSYVGTGVRHSPDNPKKILTGFPPKLLILCGTDTQYPGITKPTKSTYMYNVTTSVVGLCVLLRDPNGTARLNIGTSQYEPNETILSAMFQDDGISWYESYKSNNGPIAFNTSGASYAYISVG